MAEHRAKSLSALLSFALATGYAEIEPDLEPLKVRTDDPNCRRNILPSTQNFDTDLPVEYDDTPARFAISDREQLPPDEIEKYHFALLDSRISETPRQFMPDVEWIGALASHLNGLIDLRVGHVQHWLDSNLDKFQSGYSAIVDLRRRFDNLVIEMKANVQLCSARCANCHLLCLRSRLHQGEHSCQTAHKCVHNCEFCEVSTKLCGLGWVLFPLALLSINGAVAPDIPGNTCTWGRFLDSSPTYRCTAVPSPVTSVAIIASFWESEVASKNARRCA